MVYAEDEDSRVKRASLRQAAAAEEDSRRRRDHHRRLRKMVHARLEDATGFKAELIGSAWTAAVKAHRYAEKPFLVETSSRDFSIISFPGSWSAEGWFSGSDSCFGETKINTQLFPSIRSIGVNDYALVNSAFLHRFEAILGKLIKEVHFALNFPPISSHFAFLMFFGFREFPFYSILIDFCNHINQ